MRTRLPRCRCILSKFYIKPQLARQWLMVPCGCILSKFYIKPQLRLERELTYCVVSYRNSTSNHNSTIPQLAIASLYLIEILHQTTTYTMKLRRKKKLYLIEILHQTTTLVEPLLVLARCILSKFYIKPQLDSVLFLLGSVVSYRNSTSNHNLPVSLKKVVWLYLIEILHQTTTESLERNALFSCILSKFYIKPQPMTVTG